MPAFAAMRQDQPSATAIVVANNVALIADTPQLAHLVAPDAAALNDMLLRAYRGTEAAGAGRRLSRFVFTFMELDARGRPAFRNSTSLVRLWLALKKEPFRWGVPRDDIAAFLTDRGFSLKELAADETMRAADLGGDREATLAVGEPVCAADIRGSSAVSPNPGCTKRRGR